MSEPSTDACGVDAKWLEDNYAKALKEHTHQPLNKLSPQQVELFRSHFTNRESIQAAFVGLFKGWHTDDYPKLSVTVTAGGEKS